MLPTVVAVLCSPVGAAVLRAPLLEGRRGTGNFGVVRYGTLHASKHADPTDVVIKHAWLCPAGYDLGVDAQPDAPEAWPARAVVLIVGFELRVAPYMAQAPSEVRRSCMEAP